MQTKASIPFKLLFCAYGIIPLVWLTIILDTFFLDGKLKSILPFRPEQLRVFLIIFLWPHIIMSIFTMLDKEYLKEYKTSFLSWKLLLSIAAFALCFINKELFFYIYAIFTIKHVTYQQMGLEKMSAGPQPRLPYILFFFTLFILNSWAEFPHLLASKQAHSFLFDNNLQFHFFTLIFLLLFIDMFKRSKRVKNSLFIWGNFLLLTTICLAFLFGYPFFSYLIPRVIHDVTAIIFYGHHDYNRNRTVKNNLLFKFLPSSKYYFIWMMLFAFVFANFLLEFAVRFEVISIVLFGLGMLHYFLEDFIWKKDTPHRREILLNVDIR